jgi:preprotein translocase subunit YajC
MLSAAAASGAAPGWTGFLPIIGMVAIFWFLLIRPQMRQQKQHREKIAGVKKGDQVVTAGGLVGKVTKVDDNYAEIEIAQGVKVKAVKSTIGDIVPPGGKPAND